jgi:DNA-directed RNA polymerase subunit RPC12/RpoP
MVVLWDMVMLPILLSTNDQNRREEDMWTKVKKNGVKNRLTRVKFEKGGVRISCPSCLEEVEKEGICEKCKTLYKVGSATQKMDKEFSIQMRDFTCITCKNEVTAEDFGKPVSCKRCGNLMTRKFQKPLVYELTQDLAVIKAA